MRHFEAMGGRRASAEDIAAELGRWLSQKHECLPSEGRRIGFRVSTQTEACRNRGTVNMTAYTLHLPDDLAARLAELPAEEVNAAAARALAELLPASKEGKVIDEVPVIVFPNEDPDDHLTDAERAAVRGGISRGLADSRAGRVTPLAEWAASKLRQFDSLGTDHGAA